MYCKFQKLSGTSWVDHGKVTSPVSFGETLTDDTTMAFTITTYMKGDDYALDILQPGQIVRLNFGTRKLYLVVIDSAPVNPGAISTFKYHTYVVQELLAYFREIYIQTSYFSYGQYTLPQFFERFIALCKSDHEFIIDTTSVGYQTMLDNWTSADYQVASNAALDNLLKIGKNLQVRLKAEINASGQILITSKKLKGETTITTINGRKLAESEEYKGANIASKVVANVSNMTNEQTTWFPCNDARSGIMPVPEDFTDSQSWIMILLSGSAAANNLFVTLPFKIKSGTKVRVCGTGDLVPVALIQGGRWYDRFGVIIPVYSEELPAYRHETDSYSGLNESGTYTEFNLVEYREWLLLDPDDTNAALIHQANTLYYKRGEDKIYNIKICSGDGEDFDTIPSYTYIEGALEEPVYQFLYPGTNRYIVYGNFYYDNLLEADNNSHSNRTTIYSQDANQVSGDVFAKNMQTHIDSMQNADMVETWDFDSMDDVPVLGSIYNGFVISAIQYSMGYDKVKATIQFSDKLVAKSEYVNSDVGLMLPIIPIDKAFDRRTIYREKLWFCRTSSEADAIISAFGVGIYLNQTYFEKFINTLVANRNDRSYLPLEIRFETGEIESDIYRTAMIPAAIVASNSIVYNLKTYDNRTVGYMIDRSAGSLINDLKYYPISHINPTGKSKKITLKAGLNTQRRYESNYPAIGAQTMNLSNYLYQIVDNNYYNDPAENINISYQVNYAAIHDEDIISKLFIEKSGVMLETYDESESKGIIINGGSYYAIQTVTLTSISNSKKKISIEFQSTMTAITGATIQFRSGANTVLTMNLDVTIVDSNTRKIEFYIAYTSC